MYARLEVRKGGTEISVISEPAVRGWRDPLREKPEEISRKKNAVPLIITIARDSMTFASSLAGGNNVDRTVVIFVTDFK